MKIYRIAESSLIAYHGTCREIYREILETGGLRNVYLAKDAELAAYYAVEVNNELSGGGPILLKVIVPNTNNLRYDSNSMVEPVMVSEKGVQEAYDQAERYHPEWVKDGLISIPSSEWKISWDAVGTAFYNGVIPLNYITNEYEE